MIQAFEWEELVWGDVIIRNSLLFVGFSSLHMYGFCFSSTYVTKEGTKHIVADGKCS